MLTPDQPAINHEALVDLVRQAMASGVACFSDKLGAGKINLTAPLTDAFGDFPAEFLKYRPDLIEALTAAPESP